MCVCVYVHLCMCAFVHANMLVYMCVSLCACMHKSTSSSSPHASRGPAQEKNPNTFRPERKTDFLDESPLVKRRAFYFFGNYYL